MTPPDLTRPTHTEDGESLDSLPWEALLARSGEGDHRRWYVAGACLLALTLGVSVVRSLAPADPTDVAATASTVPAAQEPAPTVEVATTIAVPDAVTEADLMAVDPDALAREAAAVAELAATEFFSGDADGFWAGSVLSPGRSTFVEAARALSVEPVSPGRFAVTVAVSVLDAAEGDTYTRRPLRGVLVVLDGAGGGFRPVDLPYPVSLDVNPFREPASTPATPDPAVVTVAAAAVAPLGTVAGTPIAYGVLPSGDLRIVLPVTDVGGAVWPVAVLVAPDGRLRPPG